MIADDDFQRQISARADFQVEEGGDSGDAVDDPLQVSRGPLHDGGHFGDTTTRRGRGGRLAAEKAPRDFNLGQALTGSPELEEFNSIQFKQFIILQ